MLIKRGRSGKERWQKAEGQRQPILYYARVSHLCLHKCNGGRLSPLHRKHPCIPAQGKEIIGSWLALCRGHEQTEASRVPLEQMLTSGREREGRLIFLKKSLRTTLVKPFITKTTHAPTPQPPNMVFLCQQGISPSTWHAQSVLGLSRNKGRASCPASADPAGPSRCQEREGEEDRGSHSCLGALGCSTSNNPSWILKKKITTIISLY